MGKYLLFSFLLGVIVASGIFLGINSIRENNLQQSIERLQTERDAAKAGAAEIAEELDRIIGNLTTAEGELREANQRIKDLIDQSLLESQSLGEGIRQYGDLNNRFGKLIEESTDEGADI